MTWTPEFDMSTVPDKALWAEVGRRRSSARPLSRRSGGRPQAVRPCPLCAKEFNSRDMRVHRPRCKRQHKAAAAIAARKQATNQ